MTDEIVNLDAVEESRYTIAQATAQTDRNGKPPAVGGLCRSAEGEAVARQRRGRRVHGRRAGEIVSVSTGADPVPRATTTPTAPSWREHAREAVPLLSARRCSSAPASSTVPRSTSGSVRDTVHNVVDVDAQDRRRVEERQDETR